VLGSLDILDKCPFCFFGLSLTMTQLFDFHSLLGNNFENPGKQPQSHPNRDPVVIQSADTLSRVTKACILVLMAHKVSSLLMNQA